MKLEYKTTAVKQLRKIPHEEQKKIIKKLEFLREDPLAGKALKGEFNGLYSLLAWPYRIIYEVLPEVNAVMILSITHRQSAYR